jgi:plasmid stability protein
MYDMISKQLPDHSGTLNIRGVPQETIFRLKMAAAAEHRTVKGFILALVEDRIQELEKKGILPKVKG